MKLTDTLSGQLVDLDRICPQKRVGFYSCGPTVYDYPHIGNWYTFLRWDFLVRALEAQGWRVDWVMNITDVGHLTSDADDGEDKLAAQARRRGQTAWEIADFYGSYFLDGLARLNFRRPDKLPKATDHIDEQIALVKQLEDLGLTYTIADGVYYDTKKWPQYGRLGRSSPEGQPRIEPNPDKKSPSDFALWKLTPPGENRDMEWSSPWGRGFPGWHIECSAMCRHYLGPTVDIHGGGFDHIPIHHTNEIAQIEPVTGQPLAQIWLHSNFILVEGQKMAKSAGNFTVLEDIEKQGFSLAEFRLAVLAANYRTQASFSPQLLAAARQRLKDYRALAALRFQLGIDPGTKDDQKESADQLVKDILASLNNDLNGPAALAALDQFCNRQLDRDWPTQSQKALVELLKTIEHLFGVDLINEVEDIGQEQQALLDRRQAARKSGDYQTADQLRQKLQDQGLAVRDLPSGRQRWSPDKTVQ